MAGKNCFLCVVLFGGMAGKTGETNMVAPPCLRDPNIWLVLRGTNSKTPTIVGAPTNKRTNLYETWGEIASFVGGGEKKNAGGRKKTQGDRFCDGTNNKRKARAILGVLPMSER